MKRLVAAVSILLIATLVAHLRASTVITPTDINCSGSASCDMNNTANFSTTYQVPVSGTIPSVSNRYYALVIQQTGNTTTPVAFTVNSPWGTMTHISAADVAWNTNSVPTGTLSLWVAHCTSSCTANSSVISYAALTGATGSSATLLGLDGVDYSGGDASAIVQAVGMSNNGGSNTHNISVTLAALSNSNNLVGMTGAWNAAQTATAGSGFTLGSVKVSYVTPTVQAQQQWNAAPSGTVFSMSLGGTTTGDAAIAFEVKAVASGGKQSLMLMGVGNHHDDLELHH